MILLTTKTALHYAVGLLATLYLVQSVSAVDDPNAVGTVKLGEIAVGKPANTFSVSITSATKPVKQPDWSPERTVESVAAYAANNATGYMVPLKVTLGIGAGNFALNSPALSNGTYTVWAVQTFAKTVQADVVDRTWICSKFATTAIDLAGNETVQIPGGTVSFDKGQPRRWENNISIAGFGTFVKNPGFVLDDKIVCYMHCLPVDGGMVRRTAAIEFAFPDWRPRKAGVESSLVKYNVYIDIAFMPSIGAPAGAVPHLINTMALNK